MKKGRRKRLMGSRTKGYLRSICYHLVSIGLISLLYILSYGAASAAAMGMSDVSVFLAIMIPWYGTFLCYLIIDVKNEDFTVIFAVYYLGSMLLSFFVTLYTLIIGLEFAEKIFLGTGAGQCLGMILYAATESFLGSDIKLKDFEKDKKEHGS